MDIEWDAPTGPASETVVVEATGSGLRERRDRRNSATVSAGDAPPQHSIGGGISARQRFAAGGTAIGAVGGLAALAWRTRATAGTKASQSLTDAGRAAATGAGGTTTITTGSAAGATAASTTAPPVPLALPANLNVEHLLRRTTYGVTPALRAEVAKLGAGAWLARQLAPASVSDPDGDRIDRIFPQLNASISQAYGMIDHSNGTDQYHFQLQVALRHVGRAVWSKRQLSEVLVDFWSNHLNIVVPGDKSYKQRHRYDADVIRKYALGRFEDMLVASSVHPAMLAYLDGAESTRDRPNENYAREVMELHTVGIDGGYTERDIKQAALLFTGWKLAENGTATWDNQRHYTRAVTVMGTRYANGSGAAGRSSAEWLVRSLARHPATAKRLARKLAVRFVSDNPPDSLVTKLAKVYTANHTAIVPVLAALFASPEFAASRGQKVRTPMERLCATMRAVGATPPGDRRGLEEFYYQLQTTGQAPLGWPMPNGFPDVATAWSSPATAMSAFDASVAIVHGWWPKEIPLPGPKLLARPPRTRSATIDAVAHLILGRGATAQEQAAATQALKATKLQPSFSGGAWDQTETAALVACLFLLSPDFLTR